MHTDNNPKTRLGALKVPLHLIPPAAKAHLAKALENGAGKYGPYNWRDEPISASVYYGAMQRHADAWWDGEDLATDSGVHHIAHVMACCALILDAMEAGQLIDDRPTNGTAHFVLDRLQKENNYDPRSDMGVLNRHSNRPDGGLVVDARVDERNQIT